MKVDAVDIDYSTLPERFQHDMMLYIEQGAYCWATPLMYYILQNNLFETHRIVTMYEWPSNQEKTWVDVFATLRWLYNHAPSDCWGSLEKYTNWKQTFDKRKLTG